MITKLRLMLDYHCYPVWLYNEKDEIVDTLLPEELRSDIVLDSKFDDLQARYDALFIDNGYEFDFKGFESDKAKEEFLEDWANAVNELILKTNGLYTIIDDIRLSIK